MSTAATTTLTTARAVLVILTGDADWQEPLDRAARLAAATGKALRVLLTDDDALVSAAALTVSGWSGRPLVGAFDRRRAPSVRPPARLKGVLQGSPPVTASPPVRRKHPCRALDAAPPWPSSAGGDADARSSMPAPPTRSEVAARRPELHQEVRSRSGRSAAELRRRLANWLREPPEALEEGRPRGARQARRG